MCGARDIAAHGRVEFAARNFVFFAPAALSTRIYLVKVEGNESPKVSQGVGPARGTAFARYLVDLVYR